MRRLTKVSMLVALVVFVLLFTFRLALAQREVDVWLMNVNVEAGLPLDASMLTSRSLRVSDVPPGIVMNPQEVTGKFTQSALYVNLPVPLGVLTEGAQGRSLGKGVVVSTDEALFTVVVDSRHAPVISLITPGDRVDVIFVKAEDSVPARVLFTNVRIGTIVQGESGPVIHLILPRESGPEFTYAVVTGQLFLSLLTPNSEPLQLPVQFVPTRGGTPSSPRPSSAPSATPTAKPTSPVGPTLAPLSSPNPTPRSTP